LIVYNFVDKKSAFFSLSIKLGMKKMSIFAAELVFSQTRKLINNK
jgi:hypothetical protein